MQVSSLTVLMLKRWSKMNSTGFLELDKVANSASANL